MNKYFAIQYKIEDYDDLIEKSKGYIREQFENNLYSATSSIQNYRQYKTTTVSFEDVPSYKITSYKYKYIHSVNVAKKCAILAREASVSTQVMTVSGILHDVGHYICDYRLHGEKSAEMAQEFLELNSKISRKDIERISNIIRSHYPKEWDEEYYKSNRITAEEIILLEADFWDKNDLKSFIEKTGIQSGYIFKEKYLKMQKNCELLLKQSEAEQECKYTRNYKKFIYEQMRINTSLI